jgi:hypothetical protein
MDRDDEPRRNFAGRVPMETAMRTLESLRRESTGRDSRIVNTQTATNPDSLILRQDMMRVEIEGREEIDSGEERNNGKIN